MRSDGKRFRATRRMLSSRSAASDVKPSRTSVLKRSPTAQPRATLCATQSFHSCGNSLRAIRHAQHVATWGPGAIASLPHLVRHLDYQREFGPLFALGEQVAMVRAREAALRRQAQVLERYELRGFVDAALERVLRLERAGFRGDEAEHHLLPLRELAQRAEAAGALAVVLHEEAVDVRGEHRGDHVVLVTAGSEPGASEVAATGVHGDGEVARPAAQRLVDRFGVGGRERRRIVAVAAEVL